MFHPAKLWDYRCVVLCPTEKCLNRIQYITVIQPQFNQLCRSNQCALAILDRVVPCMVCCRCI